MSCSKQLLRFLLLIPVTIGVFNSSAQVQVAVKAGGNLYTAIWKESVNTNTVSVKMNPGWHVGIVADIPINFRNHNVSIQPGLLFSQKGFRQEYIDEVYGQGTLIVSPRYLELPVNIVARVPVGLQNIVVGAGGYFAYALGGNWSIEYKGGRDAGSIEFVDMDKQSQNDDKFNYGKRSDIGLNVIAGYEITPQFSLLLNGQMGFKNLAPTKNGKPTFESFRNAGIGLSAQVLF